MVDGSDDSLLAKVKNILKSLGLAIQDGVASLKEVVADRFTTKTARVEQLEMVDKATGEVNCTWIENGVWEKTEGACENEVENVIGNDSQGSSGSSSENSASDTVADRGFGNDGTATNANDGVGGIVSPFQSGGGEILSNNLPLDTVADEEEIPTAATDAISGAADLLIEAAVTNGGADDAVDNSVAGVVRSQWRLRARRPSMSHDQRFLTKQKKRRNDVFLFGHARGAELGSGHALRRWRPSADGWRILRSSFWVLFFPFRK